MAWAVVLEATAMEVAADVVEDPEAAAVAVEEVPVVAATEWAVVAATDECGCSPCWILTRSSFLTI
mgnify:CR=1 FL=1